MLGGGPTFSGGGFSVGRRAAAVNVSDLAAMGARPEFFLLSIAFSPEKGIAFPLAVARGAIARAGEFGGAPGYGGNLSAAPLTVISVALWGRPTGGSPDPSRARLPATPCIFPAIPGKPRRACASRRRLAAFAEQGSPPRVPVPRNSPGSTRTGFSRRTAIRCPGSSSGRRSLGKGSRAPQSTSPDGLGVDAGRVARASGVRIALERDLLPIGPALIAFASMEELDPVDLALSGGDDYELLFTVPEAAAG